MYVGIPRFVSLVFIAVNISFVVAPSMDSTVLIGFVHSPRSK